MSDISNEKIEQCLVLAVQEFLSVNKGIVVVPPDTGEKYVIWLGETGINLFKPKNKEEAKELEPYNHGYIVDII